ncbi:Polygalacturonase protein [Vigna angularis]|uniref:Polygalacturonase protein n=1 Tax=Phaseolus angularis TaxID=3914 RepID=A0A8T0JW03_PHAAN|nr:Polygalacturonase protein [Vigna angularis]
MKNMNTNIKTIALIVVIAFSVLSSSCTATRVSLGRKLKAASATFNVLDYGAKGDGHADDTKAFEGAWEAACKVEGSTMVVPSGSVFLVKPISFSGPNCEPNIVFQLRKITIRGKGVIDGQGSVWWNDSPTSTEVMLESSGRLPSTKPTALRFYGSDGVTVTGITIQNSQQTHLKFDSSTNVQVFDINVSSPGDSPNTDGIHLQNSQNVVIYSSTLACAQFLLDDNGGSGSVQNIMFSNVQVSGVETPISIDQYYCDGGKCGNESSAVAVSGIQYVNIKGTYTKEPIYFACSDSLPCTGITLDTIQLQSSQNPNNVPFCWEAFGELKTKTVPPVECLQSGNPSKSGFASNIDSC